MPLGPKATQIRRKLHARHGRQKGDRIFFASVNKGTIREDHARPPGLVYVDAASVGLRLVDLKGGHHVSGTPFRFHHGWVPIAGMQAAIDKDPDLRRRFGSGVASGFAEGHDIAARHALATRMMNWRRQFPGEKLTPRAKANMMALAHQDVSRGRIPVPVHPPTGAEAKERKRFLDAEAKGLDPFLQPGHARARKAAEKPDSVPFAEKDPTAFEAQQDRAIAIRKELANLTDRQRRAREAADVERLMPHRPPPPVDPAQEHAEAVAFWRKEATKLNQAWARQHAEEVRQEAKKRADEHQAEAEKAFAGRAAAKRRGVGKAGKAAGLHMSPAMDEVLGERLRQRQALEEHMLKAHGFVGGRLHANATKLATLHELDHARGMKTRRAGSAHPHAHLAKDGIPRASALKQKGGIDPTAIRRRIEGEGQAVAPGLSDIKAARPIPDRIIDFDSGAVSVTGTGDGPTVTRTVAGSGRHSTPRRRVRGTKKDRCPLCQPKTGQVPSRAAKVKVKGQAFGLSNDDLRLIIDLVGPKGFSHGWIKVGSAPADLRKHLEEHHGGKGALPPVSAENNRTLAKVHAAEHAGGVDGRMARREAKDSGRSITPHRHKGLLSGHGLRDKLERAAVRQHMGHVPEEKHRGSKWGAAAGIAGGLAATAISTTGFANDDLALLDLVGPKGYSHGWVREGTIGPNGHDHRRLDNAAHVRDHLKHSHNHRPKAMSFDDLRTVHRRLHAPPSSGIAYGDDRHTAQVRLANDDTVRVLGLDLAADSMAKATTPRLLGTHPLWHKPGFKLPDYIEHVASHLIGTHGKSRGIAMAIGIIKNWAHGHPSGGEKGLQATTIAAARLALSQWEALKAKAKTVKSNLALAQPEADVIDLYSPSQKRGSAGTPQGGQFVQAGGGQTPQGMTTGSDKLVAWAQKQIGNYPANVNTPALRRKWDNWFRFLQLSKEQQAAVGKLGKPPKPTKSGKPRRGPKTPAIAQLPWLLANEPGMTLDLRGSGRFRHGWIPITEDTDMAAHLAAHHGVRRTGRRSVLDELHGDLHARHGSSSHHHGTTGRSIRTRARMGIPAEASLARGDISYMVDLVGPKGYVHGWIHVGAGSPSRRSKEENLFDSLPNSTTGPKQPPLSERHSGKAAIPGDEKAPSPAKRKPGRPKKAFTVTLADGRKAHFTSAEADVLFGGDTSSNPVSDTTQRARNRRTVSRVSTPPSRPGRRVPSSALQAKLAQQRRIAGDWTTGAEPNPVNMTHALNAAAGVRPPDSNSYMHFTQEVPDVLDLANAGTYLHQHLRSGHGASVRADRGHDFLSKLHRGLHARLGASHSHAPGKDGSQGRIVHRPIPHRDEGTKAPSSTGLGVGTGYAGGRGQRRTPARPRAANSGRGGTAGIMMMAAPASGSVINLADDGDSSMAMHVRKMHGMKVPDGTSPAACARMHSGLHKRGIRSGHSPSSTDYAGGDETYLDLSRTGLDLAVLHAAKRKALPDSAFGLPEDRKYPMKKPDGSPDKGHAANAKARAAQMLKRGRINQAQHDKIVDKANRVLGSS